MTDPISDFLIRIKNAYMAGKSDLKAPHSKIKEALADILQKNGFIKKYTVKELDDTKKQIIIDLLYENNKAKLTEIKRISKPGRKIYTNAKNIKKVLGGLGIVIVSTSKGLLTGEFAKKNNIGGEIICEIW
jgi:small subunit ribosomal protein S8